jgi:hypothetical protein
MQAISNDRAGTVLHAGWILAVENPLPAQRPAYDVRLNPLYSISNLVAGSNHHEVFRRTAGIAPDRVL